MERRLIQETETKQVFEITTRGGEKHIVSIAKPVRSQNQEPTLEQRITAIEELLLKTVEELREEGRKEIRRVVEEVLPELDTKVRERLEEKGIIGAESREEIRDA